MATVSDKLVGAYCVFNDGTLGIWQSDFSAFAPVPLGAKWKLATIAFDDKGSLWGVNDANDVVRWQSAAASGDTWQVGSWNPLAALSGVNMLTFAAPVVPPQTTPSPMAVKTDGSVAQWAGYDWSGPMFVPKSGPQPLSMIAWDAAKPPNLWGIAPDATNDILQWDSQRNQWEDWKIFGTKKMKMLTFDSSGTMWGISSDPNDKKGNLWRWDPDPAPASATTAPAATSGAPAPGRWNQDDYFSAIPLTWLAFKPAAAAPAK